MNAGGSGELLGTGYVARDMIRIVDTLDKDGLLNYWGFSYGSALGATVAAMFPERMGKVVLDGVLNPLDYFSGRDVSQVTATDVSFDGFFTGCIANPEMCVLAQLATNADALREKVYGLIYSLKYDPFVTGPDIVSDVIDYTVVKNAIQSALLNPSTWPLLATGLHGLLTENAIEAKTVFSLSLPPPTLFPNNGQEATAAIRFSDVSLERRNTTSFPQLLQEFYATSRLLGDYLSSLPPSYKDWPFKAKGAYMGNFSVKTRSPMLFVGSKFDPLTPLANAWNASAEFEGSVVLKHGGYVVSETLLTTSRPVISDVIMKSIHSMCDSILRQLNLRCVQPGLSETTSSTVRCRPRARDVSLFTVRSRTRQLPRLWPCWIRGRWRMVTRV